MKNTLTSVLGNPKNKNKKNPIQEIAREIFLSICLKGSLSVGPELPGQPDLWGVSGDERHPGDDWARVHLCPGLERLGT